MRSTRPDPAVSPNDRRTRPDGRLTESPEIRRADQDVVNERALAPMVHPTRCRLPHGFGEGGFDGGEFLDQAGDASRMSGRWEPRASDLRPPPARTYRAPPLGSRTP